MILHPPRWSKRHQAGLELAERLQTSTWRDHDSTVIGLPGGGFPVAVAIGSNGASRGHLVGAKGCRSPATELAIGAISG